jgi:hypothetical protein
MQANTKEVLNSLRDRKAYLKAASVWTDGLHVYSYNTCILAQTRRGDFILNETKYSRTTTNHQNGIQGNFLGNIVGTLDGLDRGVTACEMLELAGFPEDAKLM